MANMMELEFEAPLEALQTQLSTLREKARVQQVDLSDAIRNLELELKTKLEAIHRNLNAWERIQLARHPQRPYSLDYINLMFENFELLCGDRTFSEDNAVIGGIGELEGQAMVFIGNQKGRDLKENVRRNFGCANPEGYRKALRLMRMAEKFKLPLLSLVDTPGAYPGIGAEERHIAEAIALNLREMSILKTPIVTVIIGEGGSGGALGMAVADKVLVLQNAYYSVISPEGCAAILWKDKAHAPRAAEALKLTAAKLLELGIVDAVVEEPLGGAHRDHDAAAALLKASVLSAFGSLKAESTEALLDARYKKYRSMGVFIEGK